MEELILDASMTMAWCFDDEAGPLAEPLLDLMPTARAYVPSLWHLEVANVLLVGERKKRITPADTAKFLSLLRALPISIDSETSAKAWSDTLNLARAHQLSAYDAAYLELAMRRGLTLATLDDKLKAAADAVGVTIYNNSPV